MSHINKKIDLKEHAVLLVIVSLLGLVTNYIGTDIGVFRALPGMFIIYAMVMMGLLISKMAPFYLPSIAWISIISVGLTLPISPTAEILLPYLKEVGFLPLTVPVLAYAGLAISQRDMTVFKKSGWKILIVGILVFMGTYLGSALVAEIVLSMQGL